MRPTSIVYFERLSLLSLMVGVAFFLLASGEGGPPDRIAGLGPGFIPLIHAAGIVLILLLILLISRKGSAIAKWIFTILFAVGVVFAVPQLAQSIDRGLIALLQLTQLVVQAAALYFLFTPEARAWFREKRA
jgi:hypothetical protein